jgi:Ca2+-transporting ATPase
MTAGAVGLFQWEYQDYIARGVAQALALAEAQTTAVTAVVMFQIFYLLNCRSLRDSIFGIGLASNPWIFVGIGALLLLQGLFIYAPPLQLVFGSASLGWQEILRAAVVGAVILPVVSVEKWLLRRRRVAPLPA